MADAWTCAPIVFEWFGGYEYLQSQQWSFEAAVDFMLQNHVTLINDNIGRVPPEAMPRLEQLARLAGARSVLREVAHKPNVTRGAALNLQMKWANTGVGKLHRRYALDLFLLDAGGEPACTVRAKADPRAWLPGEHDLTESFPVPSTLPSGEYRLALGLMSSAGGGRRFRLAFDASESGGRYEVGRVSVE